MLSGLIRKIWRDERGQDFVEYALVGAFVATAAVGLSPAVYAVAAKLAHSMSLIDAALSMVAAQ